MSQKQKDMSKLLLKDTLEALASLERQKGGNLKKCAGTMTYLRQISDSPYLLSATYGTANFRSNKAMFNMLS